MSEHKGLPVAGYVSQTDDKVNLVNQNKELEERVLRQIDAMRRDNTAHEANGQKPPYDARMMALAVTNIQEAFMWLNRSVFQPVRIALPDDEYDYHERNS